MLDIEVHDVLLEVFIDAYQFVYILLSKLIAHIV